MAIYYRKTKTKQENGLYGYYQISFWDKKVKKNVKIPKKTTLHIKTMDEAKEFQKKMNYIEETASLKARIRIELLKEHHSFQKLLVSFEEYLFINAQSVQEDYISAMSTYVFYYFLHVLNAPAKNISNINNWYLYFNQFRRWLEKDAQSERTKKNLSYSTINNIISTLNSFLTCCYEDGVIIELKKCKRFPRKKSGKRTLDDYIDANEARLVEQHLRLNDKEEIADIFVLLMNSGLRISELLGLSLNDYHHGKEVSHGPTKKALANHDINYYGYIKLTSQVYREKDSVMSVDSKKEFKLADQFCIGKYKDTRIKRKNLKSKNDSNSVRIIPIFDKHTSEILDKYSDKAAKEYLNDKCKSIPEDYLIFSFRHQCVIKNNIKKAFSALKLKPKTPHCCRHSFATNLVGMTCGDIYLASIVLGHSPGNPEITLRYLHLWEQLAQEKASSTSLDERLVKIRGD